MKILLRLSYLGTKYAGFQVQPGKPTIQSALQDALEKLLGERPPVKGCSRTDSGVHALEYFATCDTDAAIPIVGIPVAGIPVERIPIALDSLLPGDISVSAAVIVPEEFHVRHDVARKEYEYLIQNSPLRDPFYEGRAYKTPRLLGEAELARMKNAAGAFTGEHDFAGFMSAGSSVRDTVRRVDYVKIIEDGNLIRIRICADGFLYNMVRIIVGTLIETARGRIEPDVIPEIIALRERSGAGFTAPACGLYLRRVEFRGGDPFCVYKAEKI